MMLLLTKTKLNKGFIMKKQVLGLAVASAMFMSVPAMADDLSSSLSFTATQFDSKDSDSDDRLETFGLRYVHSNKMFAEEGLIHDFALEGTFGSDDNLDVTQYNGSFDIGHRFEMSPGMYFDLIAGGGYEHMNMEYDEADVDTDVRTPYAQLGAGLTKKINEYNTLRGEVGTYYSLGGSVEAGDNEVDLENEANLYAELTWANDSTGVPMEFGAYYRQADRELDIEDADDDDQLDLSQIGLRAGIRF
tara:strand:+ start:248 stop:988 length:741 start_codon:yes stop_codon:yes gene_type:complete